MTFLILLLVSSARLTGALKMLNQDGSCMSTTSSVSPTWYSKRHVICHDLLHFKWNYLAILLQEPTGSRARQFGRPSNGYKKHLGLHNWVEHELEPEKSTYQYSIMCTFLLYFPHVYEAFPTFSFSWWNWKLEKMAFLLTNWSHILGYMLNSSIHHIEKNYVMHIAFGSFSSHIIIIVKSVVRIM
jgi:hypothetical protein